MARLRRTQARYEAITTDVYDFVADNLTKVGLSFADYMDRSKESERTVQRALASQGTSWHKALTHCRIEEAKFLLAHTDLSVSVIAVRCGYKTSTLFNDVFKAENERTPGVYRKYARRG